MKQNCIYALLLLANCFMSWVIFPCSASTAGLFADEQAVQLTITANFSDVLEDIAPERNYHAAHISYYSNDGQQIHLPVQIKTRGHFRRKSENCNFPPLRLKFDPENTKGSLFEGQKKLKLVTHCQTDKKNFEQYILREYLVYKMYNLLTDVSLDVRLVQINYVDTQDSANNVVRYGFFIEDVKQMAKRVGGKSVKKQKTSPDKLQNLALTDVFQYMIGNTDWSVLGFHNIKLIDLPDDLPPYIVPYDFDWSCIVDAPYATPKALKDLGLKRPRQYTGLTKDKAVLQSVFDLMNEKKAELFALYNNSSLLNKRNARKAKQYLEEFYSTINKPEAVQEQFFRE